MFINNSPSRLMQNHTAHSARIDYVSGIVFSWLACIIISCSPRLSCYSCVLTGGTSFFLFFPCCETLGLHYLITGASFSINTRLRKHTRLSLFKHFAPINAALSQRSLLPVPPANWELRIRTLNIRQYHTPPPLPAPRSQRPERCEGRDPNRHLCIAFNNACEWKRGGLSVWSHLEDRDCLVPPTVGFLFHSVCGMEMPIFVCIPFLSLFSLLFRRQPQSSSSSSLCALGKWKVKDTAVINEQ